MVHNVLKSKDTDIPINCEISGQVEIGPNDKEKTAFSTGKGLYLINVMPFTLCKDPATFERLMEQERLDRCTQSILDDSQLWTGGGGARELFGQLGSCFNGTPETIKARRRRATARSRAAYKLYKNCPAPKWNKKKKLPHRLRYGILAGKCPLRRDNETSQRTPLKPDRQFRYSNMIVCCM
ncbi:hypothetical protein EVAR_23895_1 [Eumeta japonica]|uniref:Uncharacterized protein n=1 Tax=Eumeta variegata TaxID=151549 RepID=A0A4C1V5D8_EUMVA|nr:hypothetical protein EVAR_23895_1 [Eumeta japonica]